MDEIERGDITSDLKRRERDLSWVRAAVTVGQVLHLYADMDEAREVLRTGAYSVAAHVDRVELHRGGGGT